MEAKINIAEILKNKPQGTKLYSSACGKCELKEADDKSFKVSFYSSKFGFMNDGEGTFDKNGKLYDDGECVVFPSKEMRDWSKFAWKKGDVLVTEDGSTKVIFECFEDDTYLTFKGKYCLQKTNIDETFIVDTNGNLTECFSLQAKNIAQIYLYNIEDRIGGRLNMETLEIEKFKPKKKPVFKLGGLYVFNEEDEDGELTIIGKLIGKNESEDTLTFGNQYEIENKKFVTDEAFDLRISVHNELREATEDEAKLFYHGEALWKKNKRKAQLSFKPFDKVLCRDGVGSEWHIDLLKVY